MTITTNSSGHRPPNGVSTRYDAIIVGGGAAGLSAALVLGRQRRSVLLVDGGRPRNAPAAEMHMYLGRDGGSPSQLLADGRAELAAYETVQVIPGQVTSVGGADGRFEATVGAVDQLRARKLLFAVGGVLERQAVYHRAPTFPNTALTGDLGCARFDNGCVVVDEFGRTSVPGVFAAGDAAHLAAVPEPVTLVAPAAADGVRAAVWLEQDLFQETFSAPAG